MSWATLTIDRALLDSMEGETLKNYNASTTLGISESDDERLSFAKRNLKIKLLEAGSHLVSSGDYTSDALLDALVAADGDELLESLLAYNFLYLLYQDASVNTRGRGKEKFEFYYMEFLNGVKTIPNMLLARLTPPKRGRSRRFVGVFG
jgi:hypothetical protein